MQSHEQTNQVRIDWIVSQREAGKTYEHIGSSLEKAGHPPNITKNRVKEIIKQHRPDLMGSVNHLKKRTARQWF